MRTTTPFQAVDLQRTVTERQQMSLRLLIMLSMLAYLGIAHWAGLLSDERWNLVLFGMAPVSIPSALLLALLSRVWPKPSHARQVAGMLVDYGSLTPAQIETSAQAVLAWLHEGERVYVHCRAGWQRSATGLGFRVKTYVRERSG